jgi:ArsR family metal-binding transcriptional regulator
MTEKKYNVKTVRPCIGGGFVVEGHFGKVFSMPHLCTILQGVAKCSKKLGVARFSHEGCSVIVYKTGRIDVHGVTSEDEAIQFMDDIRLIVEDAFID